MEKETTLSRGMLRKGFLAVSLCLVLVATACQEAEPTATATSPSAPPTSTVGATAVMTPTPAASPTATMQLATPTSSVDLQCLPVPGPTPTPGPAPTATPVGTPIPTPTLVSTSDGTYSPITYREAYQKISADFQQIQSLTSAVTQGNPMPTTDILTIYEKARFAAPARAMRPFALDTARTREFPVDVAFF